MTELPIMAGSFRLAISFLERPACLADYSTTFGGIRDTPLASCFFVALPAYCTTS
jgi:hypothetical protein